MTMTRARLSRSARRADGVVNTPMHQDVAHELRKLRRTTHPGVGYRLKGGRYQILNLARDRARGVTEVTQWSGWLELPEMLRQLRDMQPRRGPQ